MWQLTWRMLRGASEGAGRIAVLGGQAVAIGMVWLIGARGCDLERA
jgi:hypothetical protein